MRCPYVTVPVIRGRVRGVIRICGEHTSAANGREKREERKCRNPGNDSRHQTFPACKSGIVTTEKSARLILGDELLAIFVIQYLELHTEAKDKPKIILLC